MLPTPTASLESLGKLSLMGTPMAGLGTGPDAVPKAANFLSQLEAMMGAVKKEAGALEGMKAKLKEMEELKAKFFEARSRLADMDVENSDLKRKLKDSEQLCGELRNDMQRLNDIFNGDRAKYGELQHQYAKLEQEMSSVLHEKDFFYKESQRIPELKSVVKATKGQLHQLKASSEEERGKLQAKVAELDKQLNQNGDHVWRLSEEIDKLKREVEDKAEDNRKLASKLAENATAKKSTLVVLDRQGMLLEDLSAQKFALFQNVTRWKREYHQIQAEHANALHKLEEKEEKLKIAQEKLAFAESTFEDKAALAAQAMGALQDTVKDLTAKTQTLSQEAMSLKQQLSSKAFDGEKHSTETMKLKQSIADLENALNTKEIENMQSTRSLTLQRDDYQFKLTTISAQLETLQSAAKAEQSKHWEELAKTKDSERQLSEEVEKLSTELHEKMAQVQALETEKLTSEHRLKTESSGSSTMIQTLKTELEKRLTELVQVREENQALSGGKEAMTKTIEDLKAELVRTDQVFKRTIEADRAKLKQELTSRTSRIKQLESEKEELLNETHQLMTQLADTQKQSVTIKATAEELNRNQNQMLEQSHVLKSRVAELQSEVRQLKDTEAQLREQQAMGETKHQAELAKYDLMVKEARKASSHQVLELTQQVKQLFEEMDDYKRQVDEGLDKERRVAFDRDKLRTDLEHLQRKFSALQDDSSREAFALKNEVIELKNKAKLAGDHKAKLEQDVLALNKELHRMEVEMAQQFESQRVLESGLGTSQEQIKAMKGTIDAVQEQRNQLAARLQELEGVIVHKNQAIEHLNADIAQVERDGLVEIRRLRLALNAAEAELNELRPAQALLCKELEDSKLGLTKALSNNNSTVSSILEDLKRTEDLLSREKKARQADSDEWRHRVKDVEIVAEKHRQEVEDLQARAKSDKQDRELKLVYLEKEIDRLKTAMKEKDDRVEELEHLHHANRKQSLESKELLDAAQAEVAQAKSMLEMEQSHRKRLETRLRQMVSSAELNKELPTGSVITRARSARQRGDSSGGYGGGLGGDDGDQSTIVTNAQSLTYGDDTSLVGGGYGYGRGVAGDNPVNYFDQGQAVSAVQGGAGGSYADGLDDLPSLGNRARPIVPLSPVRAVAAAAAVTAASPAVDRVSAALAFKLATQQRNTMQPLPASIISNPLPAVTATGLDALRVMQRPTSRPSTASNRGAADPHYDPYYDLPDEDAGQPQRMASSMSAPVLAAAESDSNAVEESIRRTQMVLNRRLAGAAAAAGTAATPAPVLTTAREEPKDSLINVELSPSGTVISTGSGRANSAGSGRSASKLIESIQVAHSLYPGSPAPRRPVDVLDAAADVSTPVLQPASPPTNKLALAAAQMHMAMQQEEDEEEEDDESDYADGAAAAAQLRFQMPQRGGGGGAGPSGIAHKPKKAVKKKAKRAPDTDSSQLPRIARPK